MEYIIWLKWGGLGDIALQRATGERVYLLKRRGSAPALFRVVDTNGKEVFHVEKARRGLGSTYLISSGGWIVGEAGSSWSGLRGYVDLAGLPAVRCKYGWGFRSTVVFTAGAESVARVTLLRGFRVRARLVLEDAKFDEPGFLVGCVLVLWDWCRRE